MPNDPQSPAPETDLHWYKKGVIYQLHVRAYYDSDGNGIGDFKGLTQKLDYLQDLGVSTVWLLPFYPSPLKDDGYDIADYYSVNPIYGNLDDFREFLDQAHRRSLRVITELVINHTSDQHPWFQQSRRAKPGSKWRDFYVWSDTTDKYKDARIIFRDFELSNWAWDPVANAYYWHRFYSHQPDLNFDNPEVHEEVKKVLDFWFDMGVDGLRLDAVPYLYEREGTNCENLRETHDYLKSLRRHVDQKYGDRMLLAEANQWPEDAVQYFGSGRGDECHMAFHFPLMPRLFMSVRMEDRAPVIDILEQTPGIPETCQWAIFLRNHDELTLEMVTEEERDFMYRVYAADARARINLGIRRRLAPLLNNDRRRIELLNALLLSMPGTPVIYYGDEIGMGDNIYLGDRNGVRTPMHWSSDKNAGFSRANPQSLYLPIILDPEYHYEAVNVEAQQRNSSSLFWWMKRILALRQRWAPLGQGHLNFLHPDNRKVLAFIRWHNNERVLVIANLSRYAQPLEIDLSIYAGLVPVEIIGNTRFPAITSEPYKMTISPHGFYWFSLEPVEAGQQARNLPQKLDELPLLTPGGGSWEGVLAEAGRAKLTRVVAGFLQPRRWFGGKAKGLTGLTVLEALPISTTEGTAYLTLISAEYAQGDPDTYVLPIAYRDPVQAEQTLKESPQAAIARVRDASGAEGLLIDATASKPFAQALLTAFSEGKHFRGREGELVFSPTGAFAELRGGAEANVEPSISKAEQSNTAIIYGDRFIFKLFRRPEVGANPDVEISAFLTERGFPNIPAMGGSLDYRSNGEVRNLGILSRFVAGSKDAWEHTMDALGRYYERVLLYVAQDKTAPQQSPGLFEMAAEEATFEAVQAVGTFLESARILGVRTAELHRTLASSEDKDFVPEPFTPHYQRSLYQSMRNQLVEKFDLLRKHQDKLPEDLRGDAERVLALRERILARYRAIYESRIDALRIRCHGDYHLGQVLSTGKDFVILDFEGEPARSLGARRLKRSPLSDIAGMIRSFHYAAFTALEEHAARGLVTPENRRSMCQWASYWYQWISATFLRAYRETLTDSHLLPTQPEEFRLLLETYLLDKAVYEIAYELNNRPAWLQIPFDGILQLTTPPRAAAAPV